MLTFTMIETPRCPFCGEKSYVMVNPEDLAAWRSGTLIQKAFPYLSVGEREQIKTGIHPECWEEAFGTKEES